MSVKVNSSVVDNSLPQSLTIITQVTLPAANSEPAKKKKKKEVTNQGSRKQQETSTHSFSFFFKKRILNTY